MCLGRQQGILGVKVGRRLSQETVIPQVVNLEEKRSLKRPVRPVTLTVQPPWAPWAKILPKLVSMRARAAPVGYRPLKLDPFRMDR